MDHWIGIVALADSVGLASLSHLKEVAYLVAKDARIVVHLVAKVTIVVVVVVAVDFVVVVGFDVEVVVVVGVDVLA